MLSELGYSYEGVRGVTSDFRMIFETFYDYISETEATEIYTQYRETHPQRVCTGYKLPSKGNLNICPAILDYVASPYLSADGGLSSGIRIFLVLALVMCSSFGIHFQAKQQFKHIHIHTYTHMCTVYGQYMLIIAQMTIFTIAIEV